MNEKILYITQQGSISRKDNTLLFENENTNKIIPIVNIEQIYCTNEVSINSKLLNFLTQKGILIHFCNYYGYYIGSYYPKEKHVSGKLLIQQVKHSEDKEKRMTLAKKIVQGIYQNIKESLLHYKRHDKKVDKYIGQIDKISKDIGQTEDIQNLLSLEGSMWKAFYSSFSAFLPQEFTIQSRQKRPPNNPMNALISFGNSVLYTYSLSKIYMTQLNPTVSYLHTPSERRFSLSLDLAELFKIGLVYKNIFNLINRGGLKKEKHFRKDMNYSLLNEKGKKKYLKFWDKRIQKTYDHPTLNRKVSYGTYIKLECYKIIKHLLGEKEYEPFDLSKKQ